MFTNIFKGFDIEVYRVAYKKRMTYTEVQSHKETVSSLNKYNFFLCVVYRKKYQLPLEFIHHGQHLHPLQNTCKQMWLHRIFQVLWENIQ